MPPLIDEEKCTRCGTCVDICQSDVFAMPTEATIPDASHADECWHCGACVMECPAEAIRLRIPLPMMVCYK
ncbi:MAG: ferredoxin [Deltaproteobacteria bacterium]|jgi:adenylylsulfate reductase subunit B|nr:ferredoxin [Deltaproteobacteria bacterium]